MKYFLIPLLTVVSFFAVGQVVIPADVARYYLEQNDKIELLEKKDSLSTQEINTLTTTIALQDSVITTYVEDSKIHKETLTTKDQELKLSKEETKLAKKEIRKLKFQRVVIIIGGVAIIILVLI